MIMVTIEQHLESQSALISHALYSRYYCMRWLVISCSSLDFSNRSNIRKRSSISSWSQPYCRIKVDDTLYFRHVSSCAHEQASWTASNKRNDCDRCCKPLVYVRRTRTPFALWQNFFALFRQSSRSPCDHHLQGCCALVCQTTSSLHGPNAPNFRRIRLLFITPVPTQLSTNQ